MGLGKYLSENGERSSLRLNMLMATVVFLPSVLAIAFNIVWKTVHGTEPLWSEISLFVAACAAYMGAIWWGKKANKDSEEVQPDKPAGPPVNEP
jgi:hypothetical protein